MKIIVVERGEGDFHAFIEGKQALGERGMSAEEALGRLVGLRAAELGLEVEGRGLRGEDKPFRSSYLGDYPA